MPDPAGRRLREAEPAAMGDEEDRRHVLRRAAGDLGSYLSTPMQNRCPSPRTYIFLQAKAGEE